MNGCKLSPIAFGMAFGVLIGVSILLVGLITAYYAPENSFIISFGSMPPIYTPSIKGAFLLGLIFFIDAFIMGFIIAWLYNKFSHCHCACCDKPAKTTKRTKATN